jgi:uncharacterized NAD(P)/FAD-binding protein YdhS
MREAKERMRKHVTEWRDYHKRMIEAIYKEQKELEAKGEKLPVGKAYDLHQHCGKVSAYNHCLELIEEKIY